MNQSLVCPELTPLQQVAGYVSIEHVAIGIIAALIIGAVILIVQSLIDDLFKSMLQALTVLCIIFSITSITGALWTVQKYQFIPLLVGSALFLASYILLRLIYEESRPEEAKYKVPYREPFIFHSEVIALVCTVTWSGIALYFESTVIASMAVAALYYALSIESIVSDVLTTTLFFRSWHSRESYVTRIASSGFVILSIGIALYVYPLQSMHMFTLPALYIGAVLFFTGMVFHASRFKTSGLQYAWAQFMMALLSVVVILIGFLYPIEGIGSIAATALIVYVAAKALDVQVNSMLLQGILFLIAAGILTVGYWAAGEYGTLILEHAQQIIAGLKLL